MKPCPISKNRKNKFGVNKTKKVWEACGGCCSYCGIKLLKPDETQTNNPEYVNRAYTFDHIKPQAKGGGDDLSNIKGACRKCNNMRGDQSLSYLRYRLFKEATGSPKFTIPQYNFLVSRGIDLGVLCGWKFFYERKK